MSFEFGYSDIKSTSGQIKFDINNDGQAEAILNSNGLGLGSTTPSSNLSINGSVSYSIHQVSSNQMLGDHSIVLANTSSDNLLLTLPYAGNVSGQMITVKRTSNENDLYITSSNLIDHDIIINLSSSGDRLPWASFVSNGVQWYMTNLEGDAGEFASSNLLLYLKLDDADGETAPQDNSGNDYHGDLVNVSSNAYEDGFINGGMRFGAGGAEYIHINNFENELDVLAQVTVSVWVKSDITNTDKGVYFSASPSGSDNRLGLRYDAAGVSGGGTNVIKASIGTDTQDQSLESSDSVQTTDWQHLVLTWKSGDSLKLYVNGAFDTPTAIGANRSGNLGQMTDFRVGQGTKDGSGSWDGLIDEFRVYNKVLTAEEIHLLYQSGH